MAQSTQEERERLAKFEQKILLEQERRERLRYDVIALIAYGLDVFGIAEAFYRGGLIHAREQEEVHEPQQILSQPPSNLQGEKNSVYDPSDPYL